jgi:hypothetical protein
MGLIIPARSHADVIIAAVAARDRTKQMPMQRGGMFRLFMIAMKVSEPGGDNPAAHKQQLRPLHAAVIPC